MTWLRLRLVAVVAVVALALTVVPAGLAQALTPVPPVQPAPDCEDTPDPDRAHLSERLGTHEAIAGYLIDRRTPDRFTCLTPGYRYEGIRDTRREGTREVATVQVRSYHRATDREHLTYSGSRHGVQRSYWPDGQRQAIEYLCSGQNVGFHRYFDRQGRLKLVVDYTHGDYEVQKPQSLQPAPTLQDVESGGSTGGPYFGAQQFRDVYDVSGSEPVRVAFGTGSSYDRGWTTWEPPISLQNWITPGPQGEARSVDQSKPVRIFINAWRYAPFIEAYQRDRAGVPGLGPVDVRVAELLRCPWLDEAMTPPSDAAVFQPPPLRPITEADRADTLEGRFSACLDHPGSRCFEMLALEQIRSRRDVRDIRQLERTALAIGYPEIARQAAAIALEPRPSFPLPNPMVAEDAALKAAAELALGLDASATLAEAVTHVTVIQKGYYGYGEASLAVAPVFNRAEDVATLRRLYEFAKSSQYPPIRLFELSVHIGIVLARQGKLSEAAAVATEVASAVSRPAGPGPAQAVLRLASVGLPADVDDTLSGLPANELRVLTLGALLNARLSRGEDDKAREALAELAQLLAASRSDPYATLLGVLAAIHGYGALGDPDQARTLFAKAGRKPILPLTALAIGMCSRGRDASAVLAEAATVLAKDLGSLTNLTGAQSRCGQLDLARATFAQALDAVGRVRNCDYDVCGNFRGQATVAVRNAILEAGLLDLLGPSYVGDTEEFRARLAVRRAELGQVEEALRDIERLAAALPDASASKSQQNLIDFLGHEAATRARVRILIVAGRFEDAKQALPEARRRALAYDDPHLRAGALIELARTESTVDPKGALADLVLARTAYWEQKLGQHQPIRGVLTALVQAFGEAGLEEEVRGVLAGFDQRGLPPAAIDAWKEWGRQRIQSEMAVSAGGSGDLPRAHAWIAGLTYSTLRLDTLRRLRQRLTDKGDKAALEQVAAWERQALADIPAIFDTTSGSRERAVAVAALADMLESGRGHFQAESTALLQRLRQEALLIIDQGERAQTQCRLGSLAFRLGDQGLAAQLFDEARASFVDSAQRRYETFAPAAGYCAGLMVDAGQEAGGMALLESSFDEMHRRARDKTKVLGVPGAYWLNEYALRYGSFEQRRFVRPPKARIKYETDSLALADEMFQ